MNISKDINKINRYVIELRREFHANPEVSMKERLTSKMICEELNKNNIEYDIVGEYGVIAKLSGQNSGRSIAVRADIDALPITEETGLEFKSTNDGVMHACGHDGHIAIALTTAIYVKKHIDELAGKVYFCFQQGEENQLGAAEMISYLRKEGVEEILGCHLWADIPSGKISLCSGPVMAGTKLFYVDIKGKGGHGSRPDQCIDPINAGCSLVTKVYRMKDRIIPSINPSIISFCTINAGQGGNIIPDEMKLSGTMRFFDKAAENELINIIQNCAKSVEIETGCDISVSTNDGLPPIVNNTSIINKSYLSACNAFGKENVIQFEKIMASDNFSKYLEIIPGAYFFAGIRNESKGLIYPHHSCRFNIDEDVLSKVVCFYLEYIFNN